MNIFFFINFKTSILNIFEKNQYYQIWIGIMQIFFRKRQRNLSKINKNILQKNCIAGYLLKYCAADSITFF